MNEYVIPIDPHPAPRMNGRRITPRIERYKRFRIALKNYALSMGLNELPSAMGFHFIIPMPKSWSNKKRDRYRGKMHQQTPDLDNLVKAVLDCLTYGRSLNDAHVGTFLFAQKTWGERGMIKLYTNSSEQTIIETTKEWMRKQTGSKQ